MYILTVYFLFKEDLKKQMDVFYTPYMQLIYSIENMPWKMYFLSLLSLLKELLKNL